MTKRVCLCLCWMGMCLMLSVSQVRAEAIWRQGAVSVEDEMAREGGKIQVGKLRVIPALKLGGQYDSNIFLGNDYTENPNNPDNIDPVTGKVRKPVESDYVFHVMPGLMLNYDMGPRGSARLGYEGDWAFYRDYTSQNWNNQRGLFNVDYRAPAGLILGINNIFDSGNDPYGDATQYAQGLTKRRWRNDLTTKVGWDFFNRFRVIGYYNFHKQKYKDDQDYTQNWTDNEFGLGVQMRVLPRTWAFLRYHYKIQDFYSHRLNTTSANDASNKQNRVNMGLIWDGGGKLGGELNFGWQWVDFDNDVDPSGAPYDNQNTWIAGTSLDYRATATTLLTLNIARLIRPTGADKREYYDDTQAGINLTQDLPYKFSAQAGFVYSRNDYNTLNDQGTEDRKDNNYNANVGVTYQIQRWLNTGIAYRYLRKDSNSISQSFTDHQVILSVGAAY